MLLTSDEIELTIKDDGRGFVPRDLGELQSLGYFGIVGMSERASTVGGVLFVASSPGSGTVVTVRVPHTGKS